MILRGAKMTATYEMILWPNCRNNCSFCFQKEQIRQGNLQEFTIREQRKSLTKFVNFLIDKIPLKSNLMIVGGELFDTPDLHPSLNATLFFVASFMKYGINELYLNTNLIYKKLTPILYFLENCEERGVLNKVHFTTSYDFDGRFRNGTDTLMLSNLKKIRAVYPQCPTYVNVMLSKACCEKILSGEFSVREFSKEYGVYVNLIPYIELIPELTAERSLIVRALQKVDNELPGYIFDYLARLDLNQEKRVFQFKPRLGKFVNCSCKNAACGHSENFARYSSKGTCYICDMRAVFGV